MTLFIYSSLIVTFLTLTSISIQFLIKFFLKRYIELIHCFAIAFAHTMFVGLSTIALPRYISVVTLMLPIFVASFAKLKLSRAHFSDGDSPESDLREYVPAFVSWFLIVALAALLTSIPIMEKSQLPDGPYVYKNWSVPVANQWAAGDLPTDNSLPYFTGEFLVRGVNLEAIHPIMPGQEIINRTFGVSFLYLAFRQFGGFETNEIPIPTFNYVGVDWPDATVLYTIDSYKVFNAVSLVTNGFLVFILAFVLSRIRARNELRIPSAILVGVFPFFVHQTFYTWTKSFGLAFIVLAIHFFLKSKYLSSGLYLALSYHVHPMALIFIVTLILFNLIKSRQVKLSLILPPITSILLWQLWTRTTNLSSDLIQQNLFSSQSLIDHFFARIGSIGVFLNPGTLSIYPFNLRNFVNSWNISGMLIALLFGLWIVLSQKNISQRSSYENAFLQISLISFFLSIFIFSKPVPVQFFGGQLLIICTLIFVLSRLRTMVDFSVFFLISIIPLCLWAYELRIL
jgi:hypothetical protein